MNNTRLYFIFSIFIFSLNNIVYANKASFLSVVPKANCIEQVEKIVNIRTDELIDPVLNTRDIPLIEQSSKDINYDLIGFDGRISKYLQTVASHKKLDQVESDILMLFSIYYRLGLIILPFDSHSWTTAKFLFSLKTTFTSVGDNESLLTSDLIKQVILDQEEESGFIQRLFPEILSDDHLFNDQIALPDLHQILISLPQENLNNIIPIIKEILLAKHPIWGDVDIDNVLKNNDIFSISPPAAQEYLSKKNVSYLYYFLNFGDNLNYVLKDIEDGVESQGINELLEIDPDFIEKFKHVVKYIIPELPTTLDTYQSFVTTYRGISLHVTDAQRLTAGSIITNRSILGQFSENEKNASFLQTTPFYHRAVAQLGLSDNAFDADYIPVMFKISGLNGFELDQIFGTSTYNHLFLPQSEFLIINKQIYRGTLYIELEEFVMEEGIITGKANYLKNNPDIVDGTPPILKVNSGAILASRTQTRISTKHSISIYQFQDVLGRVWSETPFTLMQTGAMLKNILAKSVYDNFNVPTISSTARLSKVNQIYYYQEEMPADAVFSDLALEKSENFKMALFVAALIGDTKRYTEAANIKLSNGQFMAFNMDGAFLDSFFASTNFKQSFDQLLSSVRDTPSHPWNNLVQEDYIRFSIYLDYFVHNASLKESPLPQSDEAEQIMQQLMKRAKNAQQFLAF